MEVFPLDAASDVPPYEQLRVQVASRAASGELPAGTKLPTVRALAAELHLAVNTVAKAYRALESDGVIATEGRRGTFIASSTGAADTTEARHAAAAYAALARRLGLTREEALNLVDRAW
jgi:DNA-binding transcriptional regulator YhcF (GntR family)